MHCIATMYGKGHFFKLPITVKSGCKFLGNVNMKRKGSQNIEMLGWYPAESLLPHGEKVSL